MKHPILYLFFFFFTSLVFQASAQSVIYVDSSATGMNTGTNWPNAFTDLQVALDSASAGDSIWVAAGTYFPGPPGSSSSVTFLIKKNITLLGGFNATEMHASQRDPGANETILSGDLKKNDVDDDFTSFKGDNVTTVVRITSAVSNTALIDGFTIRGGHADLYSTITSPYRDGGGVHSSGSPVISNCTFKQNYALEKGGGLYIYGGTISGALIENCRFEKNRADHYFDAGGGLYLVFGFLTVNKCHFIENEGARGGGLASANAHLTVTNSIFKDNTNEYEGGGLTWIVLNSSSRSLSIDSCTFNGNHSTEGGGLYVGMWNKGTASITNSVFEGNVASPNDEDWDQVGGGLYFGTAPQVTEASISVDNCQFLGNSSTGYASAIYMNVNDSSDCTIRLTNTSFTENRCTGYFGTTDIWTNASSSADILIENCLFENNESVYSAGLDIGSGTNAGPATFTVRNCQLRHNQASSHGGGLAIWGSPGSAPTFSIEDCQINGNSAAERAGGLWVDTNSENFQANLDRCEIRDNHSLWGSAIGAFPSEPTLPTSATFTLQNSLLTGNTGGGAMMLDSFPQFRIVNATIADNDGPGIVLGNSSGATIQNTILSNNGSTDFEAVPGSAMVTSNGGNLIGDNSFADYALSYDQQNTNPLLDAAYHPIAPGSPAIDKGLDHGISTNFDLAGNPRIHGCIDIGAYESDEIVTMDCVVLSSNEIILGALTLSPNPATDYLNIQVAANNVTPNEISIFNAQGRLIDRKTDVSCRQYPVNQLPRGLYYLKITDGKRVFTGQFVKQ